MAGAWLAASVWLVAGSADEARLTVADALPPILDLGAVVLCLGAARRVGTRRARFSWLAVALSMLVYAAGDALYAWYELGLGEVPFPSLADVAYVAYYPIVVVALLSFPASPMSRRERLRLALDSAVVVVGGAMVVWASLLRPALDTLGDDPVKAALALGYPGGDLILLFGVAGIVLRRTAGVDGHALTALVGGLFLVLVADVGYGVLSLSDSVSSQHWTDVLYMASTTAIAAAGFLQLRSPSVTLRDAPQGAIPRPLVYLPYMALLAGYGTLIATAMSSSPQLSFELPLGAAALTLLVLARQELVLGENSFLLTEQTRRESEARFRAVGRNASDAIVLVDAAGVVADATEAAKRVLGVEAEALVGQPMGRFAHADDVRRLDGLVAEAAANHHPTEPLEWRLWDRKGGWRQVETVAESFMDDPAIGKIVLTTRDVRDRKALEQKLQHVARHDILTGLPNRVHFLDRVDQALIGGVRRRAATVIAVLDVDEFKRINESLGYAVGDRLLQEIARRLERTLRKADMCARLGGDDFAMLLAGVSTAEEALPVARRTLAVFDEPFVLPEATLHLAGRVGLAAATAGSAGAAALLRNATVAMAHAAANGAGRISIFEATMQEGREGRFELEAELHVALERTELILQYQPIVDLATGQLAGAEALVRWDHPTRGRLPPSAFIPLAEESDLIDEIGAWTLRTASSQAARFAALARSQVPRISVNLSPHQVADPQLPWRVKTTLAEAGASPAWLGLELTETLLLGETATVIERLHAIRALGVSIAIDDFGTGYSSLSYLQRYPMSQIKIDRSFVAPLDDPDRDPGIVQAIVEIGRALGMATVAEGIETTRQLARLQALGCTFGQGYLLARPADPEVIADLVARAEPASPWSGLIAGSTARGGARARKPGPAVPTQATGGSGRRRPVSADPSGFAS